MIEDIVEVDADLEPGGFTKPEELAQAEIHAPRTRSNEGVAFRDVGIIENIGACGGKRECRRIKEPVATNAGVRIADDARTKTRSGEIADRIDETAGDVSRKNRIAVIAIPVRRETRAALGEHVPRNLVAAENGVFPLVSCPSEVSSFTERNVERAIRHEAMT